LRRFGVQDLAAASRGRSPAPLVATTAAPPRRPNARVPTARNCWHGGDGSPQTSRFFFACDSASWITRRSLDTAFMMYAEGLPTCCLLITCKMCRPDEGPTS